MVFALLNYNDYLYKFFEEAVRNSFNTKTKLMKTLKQFFLLAPSIAALLCSCTSRPVKTADYQVVPLPRTVELTAGAGPFVMSGKTVLDVNPSDSVMMKNAELFSGYISDLTGIRLKTKENQDRNVIKLRSELPDSCSEAYDIRVYPDSIVVNGASPAGTFYGLQTLRKAIAPDSARSFNVAYPAGHIYDKPRFPYRGAHFDTARHFFAPDSVKMFVDLLALHNINTFHWHLTDDQGWRMEIKSHPELAEKGQWRSGTVIGLMKDAGHDSENVYDTVRYGGYYTQDQIRDIIKYAADRHITVVPEIDMPGHMQALLSVYPELGCTGGPYEAWKGFGISKEVLCAGNDSVFGIIKDVLNEVVDLFPGEYIHIGGDECPKDRWNGCAKCQARIKELGLRADSRSTAEQKLQTWFMAKAADYLQQRGRKVIGWNEMMEGGLPEGAVVMSWVGIDGAIEAARMGHDAILTPYESLYFDFAQGDPAKEPLAAAWSHPVLLKDVYDFNPAPEALTADQQRHIVGVQANLWCEYVPTFRHAQYMELPRMAALSEVQWCAQDKKSYDDFMTRLPRLAAHYDALGYNYARHTITPPPGK